MNLLQVLCQIEEKTLAIWYFFIFRSIYGRLVAGSHTSEFPNIFLKQWQIKGYYGQSVAYVDHMIFYFHAEVDILECRGM